MSVIADRILSTGLGMYLAIVGLVLLFGGIGLLGKRIRIASGLRADGQIIGYQRRMQQHAGEKPSFMPLIRFQPRGGAPVEFQSRMSADPQRWPEGTLIQIAYRADRPEQAEIATAARLWLAPPLIIAFGLACFAIAWQAGR